MAAETGYPGDTAGETSAGEWLACACVYVRACACAWSHGQARESERECEGARLATAEGTETSMVRLG
jgi:hypothetical protein